MKRALIFQGLILTSLLLPGFAFAQDGNLSTDLTPPEIEGTFDVPRHPELKVKVHIYHPKNKATNTPAVNLVCNAPDPDSNAVVGTTGWHLPSSVTYRLNLGSVPSSVGSSNMATITSNSFSKWISAVSNKINFANGANVTVNRANFDSKNIIAWGRTSNNTLAVTYTWYYTASGLVAETDTIFNRNLPWAWANNTCPSSNSYDVQDILTHELGHWMGLDDEYTGEFVDNTMFGYGSKGEIKKNTLTTGDSSAVSSIYP